MCKIKILSSGPKSSKVFSNGLEVFPIGSWDFVKDQEFDKKPDFEFIIRLEKLGYSIIEHSLNLVLIIKNDTKRQACVIFNESRVSFFCDDVELLKLVYVFLMFTKPTKNTYNDFCKDTYKDFYLSKNDFIEELNKFDFELYENNDKFDILAYTGYYGEDPKIGIISGSNRFKMSVYNKTLLLNLFRYSLTPSEYR